MSLEADIHPRRDTVMPPMPLSAPALFWVLVGLLSLLQFHVYLELHRNDAWVLAQRALEILDGRPYWRAYQNRLLGPWLVRLLARIVRDDRSAFLLFAGGSLALTHIVAGAMARAYLRREVAAAFALSLFSLGYVLLFDQWSYPWDFIETITFLFFSYVVLMGRRRAWVLPIFVVAVLNRESSLFIGAWFVVAPLVRKWLDRDRRLEVGEIMLGVALMVLAAAFTLAARRWLFVSASGALSPATQTVADNLVTIRHNLDIVHFRSVLGLALFLLCAAFAWSTGAGAVREHRSDEAAFAVLIGIVLVQLLLFSVLNETRVFYTLLAMIFVASLRSAARRIESAAAP